MTVKITNTGFNHYDSGGIDNLLKIKRKKVYPKIGLKGSLFLIVFSFVLAWLLIPKFTLPRRSFVEGEKAPFQIKAHRSFDIVDEEATQKLRNKAASDVRSIYDYDRDLYSKTVKKLFSAFELMKKEYYIGPAVTLSETQKRGAAKKAFEEALFGISISDTLFDYLEKSKFNWKISWSVNRLFQLLRNRYIISDKAVLEPDINRGILIRNLSENKEEAFEDFGQLLDLEEARRLVVRGTDTIRKWYSISEQRQIAEIAAGLMLPNVAFNQAETAARRKSAEENIKAVIVKVEKGSVIVRKGEPIQKSQLVILRGIQKQFTEQRPMLFVFFTAIFLFFLFQIIGYFAIGNLTKFKPSGRDVLVLSFLAFIFILAIRIYLFAAGAIQDKILWLPPSVFIYLIPIASCAMIVRFLIGIEGALIFSILLSVAFSLLLEKNFFYAIYALTSCLIGIQEISYCRSQRDIYRAGIKTAVANMAVVFSMVILSSLGGGETYEKILAELGLSTTAAFLSGLLSAVVVMIFTPAFEYLFNYTTDLKLLDLSNLNHPVLRDLMLRAPGSYHHSIVVGTLAENAAESIGANVLLSRVGGYYHDIGKMKNPHYYIENQFRGYNIHDHVSAHLSRMMIMSHVKEGVKIGTERNIGKSVVDIIEQHLGTTLMNYFYQKAKKEAQARHAEDPVYSKEVDENEYRYPGPRPQTNEAAIVMMADSVEAAARTLNTSHLPRIRTVCEKMIHRLFIDGQLNDTELTLKDLTSIVDSFYHVLVGIYHRRISYPVGGVQEEKTYGTGDDERSGKGGGIEEENPAVDEKTIFKKMGK